MDSEAGRKILVDALNSVEFEKRLSDSMIFVLLRDGSLFLLDQVQFYRGFKARPFSQQRLANHLSHAAQREKMGKAARRAARKAVRIKE